MTIILADIGGEQKAIEEERQEWLQRVLVALGADKEIISQNTLEAKQHVSQLGLSVENHVDGTLEIFRLEIAVVYQPSEGKEVPVETKRKTVAQWLPPKIIRIREASGDHHRIILQEWALPFQTGG